jgi:CRISPR-associated protein (TIGR02710 family)
MSTAHGSHPSSEVVLLICTVGGTEEAIAHSLLHWSPARVLFVPSEKTRATTNAALKLYAERAGRPLPTGSWEIYPVSDEEDFEACVREMRRALDAEVHRWLSRGESHRVIADFTGGTKCMSAALALVARPWRCEFSYVGGQRRNKGSVGVVESGAERVVHSANPWDALGYQAVEQAIGIFNHGGYAAAAALLDSAMKNSQKPELKRELATLKAVADAYAAWERFDHEQAHERFDEALKNRNDLYAIFGPQAPSLENRFRRHRDRAKALAESTGPSVERVVDLFQNAHRQAALKRFDDAVARLYRATEALAQVRLRERYNIDTSAVGREQLPPVLQEEWASRYREGQPLMLGLQEAYRVLREFGDELGRAFDEAELADRQKSPLVTRNHSILAHGFQPVGQDAYEKLKSRLRRLLERVLPPEDAKPSDDRWELPEPERQTQVPAQAAGSFSPHNGNPIFDK